MTITLAELTKLIHNKPIEEMLQVQDQYGEFVDTIDSIGSEILQDLDRDCLVTAVTLIQSCITANLIEEGDVSIKDVSFLMSSRFASIVTMTMKMSVGLAAVEELR